MNHEYHHLKKEIQLYRNINLEHSKNTTNLILIAWGAVLMILANIKPIAIHDINVSIYFMIATVLFISNCILYFAMKYRHANTIHIWKAIAYIIVFHEKKPPKKGENGETNCCYEMIKHGLRIEELNDHKETNNVIMKFLETNTEHAIYSLISIIMMFVSAIILLLNIINENNSIQYIVDIALLTLCCLFITTSCMMYRAIRKRRKTKYDIEDRYTAIIKTIEYAIEKKYCTRDELKNRLSDEIYEKYLGYKNERMKNEPRI